MLYSQMSCSMMCATWMTNHNSCCKLNPHIHLVSSSHLWLNKEEKTYNFIYIFIFQLDCLPDLAFLQFSLACLRDFKKLPKRTSPPFPPPTFLCPPELHHSIHTCSVGVWGFWFPKIPDFLLLGD